MAKVSADTKKLPGINWIILKETLNIYIFIKVHVLLLKNKFLYDNMYF